METVQENINLSDEEKLRRLKEAKGGTWYDGYEPYCCMCSTSIRMDSQPYGFRCRMCGNMICFNLTRLQESPLNNISNKSNLIYCNLISKYNENNP